MMRRSKEAAFRVRGDQPPSSFATLLLKSDLVLTRPVSCSIRLRWEHFLISAFQRDRHGSGGHVMRLIQRNGGTAGYSKCPNGALGNGPEYTSVARAPVQYQHDDQGVLQKSGRDSGLYRPNCSSRILSPTMLQSILIGGTLPAHFERQATDRGRAVPARWGPSIGLTHRLLWAVDPDGLPYLEFRL